MLIISLKRESNSLYLRNTVITLSVKVVQLQITVRYFRKQVVSRFSPLARYVIQEE